MEKIPTGPLARDKDRFMQLLEAVQDAANQDEHWKLVSITLASDKLIDPLAVLESIYETGDRHCYIEHPLGAEALAGAEAVIERIFSGKERFAKARDFTRELFEHTVAVGQLDLPLAGPKVFAALTFEDEEPVQPEGTPNATGLNNPAPFAPATLFVPRWQVSVKDGAYVATANLLVTPGNKEDLKEQAERALEAHRKFSSFSYDRPESITSPACGGTLSEDNASAYEDAVEKALGKIEEGLCTKLVISRSETFTSLSSLHPLSTLARMRDTYPSCHCFSFAGENGLSFIGATPERLIRVENGTLHTEAIAGTAPRGQTSAEDASFAASLMQSDKQMREHMAVAESIRDNLEELGIDSGPRQRSRLMRLTNAQHIKTPFSANMPSDLHILDIAARLHPTPATAGLPKDTARKLLREIEGSPRGLYCGLCGWMSEDEGELVVTLRSGFVHGAKARLHAGAGIVQGSASTEEREETSLKMSALSNSLGLA